MAESRPRFPERTQLARDSRVLVLFCHPKRHRSRVNRHLVEAIVGVPHVTVHDLYEAYPEGHVSAEREQALLEAHETLILQHPFYWYSVPPLLKEWFDVVLTWGWAYGRGGTALRGKRMVTAITAGGSEEAYSPTGYHGRTVQELLAPVAQTAFLCGMDYPDPFVVYGTHRLEDDQLERAAKAYRALVAGLAGVAEESV